MVWNEEGALAGSVELSPKASDLDAIQVHVLVGSRAKRLLTVFFLTLQEPLNYEQQHKLENDTYDFLH